LAIGFVGGLSHVCKLFVSELELVLFNLLELLFLFFLSQQVLLELVQLSHLIIHDLVVIAATGVRTALDAGRALTA
jgi:hypothetical protein